MTSQGYCSQASVLASKIEEALSVGVLVLALQLGSPALLVAGCARRIGLPARRELWRVAAGNCGAGTQRHPRCNSPHRDLGKLERAAYA